MNLVNKEAFKFRSLCHCSCNVKKIIWSLEMSLLHTDCLLTVCALAYDCLMVFILSIDQSPPKRENTEVGQEGEETKDLSVTLQIHQGMTLFCFVCWNKSVSILICGIYCAKHWSAVCMNLGLHTSVGLRSEWGLNLLFFCRGVFFGISFL